MFDRVEIVVRAGAGGGGAISFRREKYVPYGGPDGGDGGDGGAVVIVADASVSSLRKFEYKKLCKAEAGGGGKGKRQHGRNGKDLILTVPVGTVISSKITAGADAFIADLEQNGQKVVVVGGGKGGRGNIHYASSTNQAPQIAQKGEAGEEKLVILEMRLIADVGIIGYPNAGKSTLLAAASAAKPKVAGYPFTTIEPVLGVVEVGQRSFIMAEIPGLITGAHLGRGLGHDFLRHIIRTRMLIHLVDGGSADPVEDMARVNEELSLFDPALGKKLQIVVVNKIDLPDVQARMDEIRDAFGNAGIVVLFISAETGEGVPGAMAETLKILQKVADEQKSAEANRKVFRPLPRGSSVSVYKEGDIFIVVAPELERIVTKGGVVGPEVRWQLRREFAQTGVDKTLEKAGIEPGDRIRCGSLEWEW